MDWLTDNRTPPRRRSWFAHARRIVLALAAGLMLFSALVIFPQIDRQLRRTELAESDNRTWVIAQIEVDLLRLNLAVGEALLVGGTEDASDPVRLRFDILFSRVNLLNRSSALDDLPFTRSETWRSVAGEGGAIERMAAIVDRPGPIAPDALEELRREVIAVLPGIRDEVVRSVTAAMEISDQRRGELRAMLQVFAASAAGLFVVLSFTMAMVIAQGMRQKRYGEMLRDAVFNLRSTVDASLDAVLIVTGGGEVIGSNRSGRALFGLGDASDGFSKLPDLLAFAQPEPRHPDILSMLRDERAATERQRMTGRAVTGRSFPVEVNATQIRSAAGELLVIAFIRDISERVEREERLKQARNDALKAEEAKSRFLAVMSHEMRTPLNGLHSAVDLLIETTTLNDRQKWLAGIVKTCAGTTLEQVNNVLDLTRLAAADAPRFPESAFQPLDVLRDLASQGMPEALRRGVTLSLEEPQAPIPWIVTSRQLFQRAVGNLVGNAIKFTEKGSIVIAAEVLPEASPGRARLRISVRDTGKGIAAEDLERIFHNFETIDDSYTRVEGGSGLGLGIAQLSAEAIGGRISVQSRLGEGSTFTLELTAPVTTASDPKPAPDPGEDPPLPALSLLLAEDNPINRELLGQILRLRGHEVVEAVDGAEAVALAAQRRFDAILMDISMPRMDGLEATRRIRACGQFPDVPIVGVTAQADRRRRESFLAVGMSAVVTKPVDPEELFAELRGLLAGTVEGPGQLPSAAQSAEGGTAPPGRQDGAGELDAAVLDDLEARLGAEALKRFLGRCLEDVDRSLAEILALEAAGDTARSAEVAHRCAGGVAVLGLTGLQAAFADFEDVARSGKMACVTACLHRLRRERDLAQQALAQRGLVQVAGPPA